MARSTKTPAKTGTSSGTAAGNSPAAENKVDGVTPDSGTSDEVKANVAKPGAAKPEAVKPGPVTVAAEKPGAAKADEVKPDVVKAETEKAPGKPSAAIDAPAGPATPPSDAGKIGAARDRLIGAQTTGAKRTDGATASGAKPAGAAKPTEAPTVASSPEAKAVSEVDASDRTRARDASATDIVTVAPPVEVKRGPGFAPLVLGGLVAGAIGYAIPTFLMPPPQTDTARLEVLEAKIAELPTGDGAAPVDLSSVEAAQEALSTRLDEVTARLDTLESAPAPEAAPAPAPVDLGPLRTEIGGVSAAVDSLRADLEPRIGAVETGLANAASRADDVQDEAQALARETARNQVTVALQSGAVFAEPLAVLGEAPAALSTVAGTGVATDAALIAAFPPLAREALRASRDTAPAAGVGSLFRNAFNARSLEPREGDDPDAILSRAEAAVRAGGIETALTEIAALPEEAQAILSDWTARARARADALSAAQDFLKDG